MWRVMIVGVVLVLVAGVVAVAVMWGEEHLDKAEAPVARLYEEEAVQLAKAHAMTKEVPIVGVASSPATAPGQLSGGPHWRQSTVWLYLDGHQWEARWKGDGTWVVTAKGTGGNIAPASLSFVVDDRTGRVTGP